MPLRGRARGGVGGGGEGAKAPALGVRGRSLATPGPPPAGRAGGGAQCAEGLSGALAAPVASAGDEAHAPGRRRIQPFPGPGPVAPARPRTAGGGPSPARALPGPPRTLRGACGRLPAPLTGHPALLPLVQIRTPPRARVLSAGTSLSLRCRCRRPRNGLPGDSGGRCSLAAAGRGLAALSEASVRPRRGDLVSGRGAAGGRGGLLAAAET